MNLALSKHKLPNAEIMRKEGGIDSTTQLVNKLNFLCCWVVCISW